jgi:hypothetical protein
MVPANPNDLTIRPPQMEGKAKRMARRPRPRPDRHRSVHGGLHLRYAEMGRGRKRGTGGAASPRRTCPGIASAGPGHECARGNHPETAGLAGGIAGWMPPLVPGLPRSPAEAPRARLQPPRRRTSNHEAHGIKGTGAWTTGATPGTEWARQSTVRPLIRSPPAGDIQGGVDDKNPA